MFRTLSSMTCGYFASKVPRLSCGSGTTTDSPPKMNQGDHFGKKTVVCNVLMLLHRRKRVSTELHVRAMSGKDGKGAE